MQHSRRAIVACIAGASLAVPGVAGAATKNVLMGTPTPKAQKALEPYAADVNDYFPHATTIRQGDRIRFVPTGFHTAELLGDDPTPLLSPTGDKASSTDAAGQPFWFNGQDVLAFSPPLVQPNFGKRLTFDGSENLNTGLPLQDKPKPMNVKFTRRGTFTFICNLHPGMEGKVKVVRRGAKVPSRKADGRRAARQFERALKVAKGLEDQMPPANTVDVGVAGRGGVERLAFQPEQLRVAPGTTVTFRMSPRSYDVHTATAGPGDPEREPDSYIGRLAASFQAPVFDPAAVYPSEPPGTVASLSPATHGNGFWNSGVLDASDDTPLPASSQVRFDTPGTFTFVCLIHPFMKGTVQVG